MIWPALVHVVFGHAEFLGGGQLLQRRLPVQASAQPGRAGDHRVEQAVHERVGLAQAAFDVDGAEHGLERVGEYRRLVPAAGALFALAEPDVGA